MSPQSVLVVSDEPAARRGLAAIIDGQRHLKIHALAGSVREARRVCEQETPQVTLLDPAIDHGEGFHLIREWNAHYPAMRLVVIARSAAPEDVTRALRAGARGYVLYRDHEDRLLDSLAPEHPTEVTVAPLAGQSFWKAYATGELAVHSHRKQPSPREQQVLHALKAGHRVRRIAELLNVSPKTVETHIQNLKDKLGARTVGDLRGVPDAECAAAIIA